jgi:hypothetical protein
VQWKTGRQNEIQMHKAGVLAINVWVDCWPTSYGSTTSSSGRPPPRRQWLYPKKAKWVLWLIARDISLDDIFSPESEEQ